MSAVHHGEGSDSKLWRIACWGSFLLLLGIYLFSHPGRIDMIDGQFRFEVSRNIVDRNGPIIDDLFLIQGPLPLNPKTGQQYSFYTAPASLTPIPLMVLSRAVNGANTPADRFAFSIFGAFASALIGPLLLAFYRRLNVPLRPALGWTFLFALCTLWWPGAETVFDQAQHGVVLLAMVLCAYDAAKRGSIWAAFAVGLLGGLLFNYRTPFLFLLPVFPIYWWCERRRESGSPVIEKSRLGFQLLLFALGVGTGLAAYAYYNWIRFGQFSMPAFKGGQMLGNPITGFLTLAVSPGKGVFWYSPPLILAAFGISRLLKSYRGLGWLIVSLTVLHVGEMSCLAFAGGDWCWGPRYLLPVMPLWALVFPFVAVKVARRSVVVAFAVVGFTVQLLGNSLDHHRFFYYRQLGDDFWLDRWCYFQFSQLAARPGEIWQSIAERDRVRPRFNSNMVNEATYCPIGPPRSQASGNRSAAEQKAILQREIEHLNRRSPARAHADSPIYPSVPRPLKPIVARIWVQQFGVFYLPRPWWGWINHVPRDQRPVNPRSFFLLCTLVTGAGAALVVAAARKKDSRDPEAP